LLAELTITNFAIIDNISLRLVPGFSTLSGETGAGKSIIIDAVSALLGERFGPEFVRTGTEQARIEGVFVLGEREASLQPLLAEYGLEPEDGALILTRDIHRSGRTGCRINRQAVPVSLLQQVGNALVDIHGQSEHLSLLKVGQHIDFLDRYAGLEEQRGQVAAKVAALRQVRRELASLIADEREIARRVDLLRYQIEEITAANLVLGEEEELRQERLRLQNAERLMAFADTAYQALYASSDERRAACDLVTEASAALEELARIDPSLAAPAQSLGELGFQLEDLARTLRAYRDSVEHNPARLEQIEERLDLLHNLKRKYGATLAEVLAFRERAIQELDSIAHSEERIAELQGREAALRGEIGQAAERLSLARQQAAAVLAASVEGELSELNMLHARFSVDLRRVEDKDGVEIGGARYAFDATGVDKVEFLISPNPGEPLKPLVKIASGGEASRLLLALKSILSEADQIPTLIFDEIDVGIGGRSGGIVGEKLWRLTPRHQVLCVTHLPQLACFADAHYSVAKAVIGEHTVVSVQNLSPVQRIEEMAAMLGGTGESARQNAQALAERAAAWKKEKGIGD